MTLSTIPRDRKRLFFFIIFISVLMIPLIVRLAMLMLFPDTDKPDFKSSKTIVERGPILDRNGNICAIETRLKSVSAWIPDIKNIEDTSTLLAQACEMKKESVLAILNGSTGFVFIRRKADPAISDRVAILKSEGKLPGILLEDELARIYPQGDLASHLIGFVDIDEKGLDGIEKTYEDDLSPKPPIETDDKSISGNQVFLTIDINLQFEVEAIADRAREENDAESCMIIVMAAKTGEILAYSSTPAFNPNDIANSTPYERINHIAVEAYEPGSVFKVFTIASFLEAGGITTGDEFECTGEYKNVRQPITCTTVHGSVSPLQIIKYSCNVGAAYASESVEREAFYRILTRWGFGSKTGIELPGETAGIVNRVSKWSERSKPAIAFGQEISVSALQVVQAASALANHGMMLKPLIVKKIVSPRGSLVREQGKVTLQKVISPRTAYLMLEMMESTTVGNGTSRLAAIDGIRISAKTGTAQVYDPKSKRYSDDEYTPSILGIFPTNDPEYIVYAVLRNVKGTIYFGSRIAAPLFKEVAQSIISVLKFPTSKTTLIEHPHEIDIPHPDDVTIGDVMPDLTGTPKKLLLPLFQRDDIAVRIRGEGFVVRQRPDPGEPIVEGMTILLELE